MLRQIAELDWLGIRGQVTIVFVCWIIVLLAVAIDLYFGIKKSKEEGRFVHSYGLKQTTKKSVLYLSLMMFAFFIDILNPVWHWIDYVQMPIMSIFGAVALVYTEYKSVREKNVEKVQKEIEQNVKELYELMKSNKDILKELKRDE